MKKIFCIAILFFAVACNSGGNTNKASDAANPVKGNSPGSNIEEMDTSRMDTSGHSISADSAKQ